MKRRDSRIAAFILLYQSGFHAEDAADTLIENNQPITFTEEREEALSAYSRALFEGAMAEREELDALVEKYAIGWKKKRISRVSLAALELAIYEMRHPGDVDRAVIINEGVEIAKRYDGQEAAAFVNGILGAVARDMGPEPDKAVKAENAGEETETSAAETISNEE